MTHTLRIELPDEAVAPMQEAARLAGQTVEAWAADQLRRCAPAPAAERHLSAEERAAALADLMRHTVDLGYATGADNESIDRDLARAYEDTHEEE